MRGPGKKIFNFCIYDELRKTTRSKLYIYDPQTYPTFRLSDATEIYIKIRYHLRKTVGQNNASSRAHYNTRIQGKTLLQTSRLCILYICTNISRGGIKVWGRDSRLGGTLMEYLYMYALQAHVIVESSRGDKVRERAHHPLHFCSLIFFFSFYSFALYRTVCCLPRGRVEIKGIAYCFSQGKVISFSF